MKIDNNDLSSRLDRSREKSIKKSGKAEKPAASFRKQLGEINEKEIKERLDKLLNIVDEQGKKLKKSLDKKDLIEYKKRVKDFLRLVQKEFVQARQSYSWDGAGNLKTYTLIEEADKNLNDLHQLFMQEQSDVLEIVKKIDEIRGLLLDIYI